MHDKRCLASAIIAAVENARDAMESFDFRIYAQENRFLTDADEYLTDGTADCTCGERKIEELLVLFGQDPAAAQFEATLALQREEIRPEQYMRLARRTREHDRERRERARNGL